MLVAIDVFSRKAFVAPMKEKTPNEVKQAFDKLLFLNKCFITFRKSFYRNPNIKNMPQKIDKKLFKKKV